MFFNDKSIDAFVSFFFIGLRDDDMVISGTSIGDPVFGTIQEVVIAMINGGCTLLSGVATRFGFAQAKCA